MYRKFDDQRSARRGKATGMLGAHACAVSIALLAGSGLPAGRAEPKAPSSSAPIAVWIPTNAEKVRRDAEFPVKNLASEIKMESARNEYESAQVILRAAEKAKLSVSVEVSDFVGGERKSTLPASAIRLYQQAYIEVTKPTKGEAFPAGWYPDALIPLNKKSKVEILPGLNQGLWLTVKVPKNQAAGLYRGTLRIMAGKQVKTIPLTLNVWDFALTDEGHNKTSFPMFENRTYHFIAPIHKVPVYTPEYWKLLENYYWFQVEYRIPPADLPIPHDDVDTYLAQAARFLNDPRVYNFRIPVMQKYPRDGKPYAERLADRDLPKTKELVDKMRANGWLKKGYFYLSDIIDEPSEAMLPLVRQLSLELEEIAPDVPHILTHPPTRELFGAVSGYCVLLNWYDPYVAQTRQAAGDHIWWYGANYPQYPYPSYHIDDLLLGSRILSWMQRMNKVEGNLYWNTVGYARVEEKTGEWVPGNVWKDPLMNPVANGEGVLIYPGAPLGIHGPVPSIRVESIREGMEDYEYLATLESLLQVSAKRLGLTDFDIEGQMNLYYARLFRWLNDYDHDPQKVLQVRREIAERIVGLQKNPDVLYSLKPIRPGRQFLTVYAEKGKDVNLDGQKLPQGESGQHSNVYRQMLEVQPGMVNRKVLSVGSGKVALRQTISLVDAKPVGKTKVMLNDVETGSDLAAWTAQNAAIAPVGEHATQGSKALKVSFETNAAFPAVKLEGAGKSFRSADWSAYTSLYFDVYNAGDRPLGLAVRFSDSHGNQVRRELPPVAPATATWIDVPFEDIAGLDIASMHRIEIELNEPQSKAATIYLDNVHFTGERAYGSPPPPSQDRTHRVRKAKTGQIKLDGKLDEPIWALDHQYGFATFGKTESIGRFGFAWDGEYLYAAFDITDKDVHPATQDASPWKDDGVEFFIDGDFIRAARNEHAPQLIGRFGDDKMFLIEEGVAKPQKNIVQKSLRTATGYTLEMAVPWSVIGVKPYAGKQIGLTSHLTDNYRLNGEEAYGVMGFTANGTNDQRSSAFWRDFILSND